MNNQRIVALRATGGCGRVTAGLRFLLLEGLVGRTADGTGDKLRLRRAPDGSGARASASSLGGDQGGGNMSRPFVALLVFSISACDESRAGDRPAASVASTIQK